MPANNSEKVGFFTEHARGTEWLSWAAGQPEFQQLFNPAVAPTGCSGRLAYWFAERYVMDEGLTESALSAVQEAGGRLAPAVRSAIGHHLHLLQGPRPLWLGPWIVLLVQNAPEQTHQWLDYALTASRWPEDRVAVLLLFDIGQRHGDSAPSAPRQHTPTVTGDSLIRISPQAYVPRRTAPMPSSTPRGGPSPTKPSPTRFQDPEPHAAADPTRRCVGVARSSTGGIGGCCW